MQNLSRHTDLPCELVTSLLIRGIQMGERSILRWLIGLVKHAIWAEPPPFFESTMMTLGRLNNYQFYK
jgi:hypothetical protein